MDSIDQALIDAWTRVSQQLRDDPGEAARRFARLKLKTMQRPVRPWCLRLRASDTRINRFWIVAPELAPKGMPPPKYPPHQVGIDGDALRALMKPVKVDWPGVDWTRAAAMLGRHQESLRGWIKRGVFKVNRYPARSVGKIGNPVPFIWAHSPIDPNTDGGPRKERGREWGESWMGLWEKIPEEFGQIFRREPVLRTWRKETQARFRGWQFVCPGRMLHVDRHAAESVLKTHRDRNPGAALRERNGKMYIHLQCEKRVDSLYCPMPVWTISKWMGDLRPMVVGEEEVSGVMLPRVHVPGAKDTVMPGMEEWGKDMAARAFACAKCWGVRHCAMTNRHGWNEMVSHLSGGLLYGHEVERPREGRAGRVRRTFLHGKERRVEERVRVRRERVEEMLMEGKKMRVIAERLGVREQMVWRDARVIYGRYGVRRRREFVEMRGAMARHVEAR